MNKAQELIAWFKENGTEETSTWDLEEIAKEFTQVDYDIIDQGRWETFYESIWKLKDDSYVQIEWQEGSTEYQDSTPPTISLTEVEPYEEIVIKYRAVK